MCVVGLPAVTGGYGQKENHLLKREERIQKGKFFLRDCYTGQQFLKPDACIQLGHNFLKNGPLTKV